MGFVLSEEQTLLQETARQFFAEQLPIGVLRRLRDADDVRGYDEAAWKKMAELGFAGILIPEAHGGSGFGPIGMGLIVQEAGRHLSPSPLYASAVLGAGALIACGSEAQKKTLLPQIASGAAIATLAVEESGHHRPAATACRAQKTADGFVLSGQKLFVPDGQNAQHILILARTDGEPGDESGLSLFLVPQAAKGLTVTPLAMVDARASAMLDCRDLALGKDALLGKLHQALPALEPVLDLGRIILAAEMLGGAEAVFEQTLAWLKERKQFDVPIGSFQALQHRAAQLYCEIEICRSVVLDGLTAAEEKRKDMARAASLAKMRLSDASRHITNEGVQMHGGVGMTDDMDLGLYLKRARVQAAMLGDANFHTSRYARLGGY